MQISGSRATFKNFYSNTLINMQNRFADDKNLKFQENLFLPEVFVFSEDEDCALMFKVLLETWNYRVKTISEWDQLEINLSENTPALILMDVSLPFLKSLETLQEIRTRQNLFDVPVIAISGYSQSEFRHLAWKLGVDTFLAKPIDFDLLETYLKFHISTPF